MKKYAVVDYPGTKEYNKYKNSEKHGIRVCNNNNNSTTSLACHNLKLQDWLQNTS